MALQARKSCRWLCAGLLAACLAAPGCPPGVRAADAQAVDPDLKIRQACGFFAKSPAGRLEDLELFVLAEAWAGQGFPKRAASYQEYLRTYYPRSLLLPLLGPPDPDAGFLESFDADPDFSRLIKAGCQISQLEAAPAAEPSNAWMALVCAYRNEPESLPDAFELQTFLKLHPDSPLAGWAAYQLLWEQRLIAEPAAGRLAVMHFAAGHRGHALAAEAAESLDLEWFSARDAAFKSVLLPGWGEEMLEPGLRASSGPMYSEGLYALGLIGFSVASRQSSRLSNLTGAIIFANLLMLNHVSSANNAFQLAQHRNWSSRRKFISGRLDQPVLGAGRFEAPESRAGAWEGLAQELVLSLIYRPAGIGEAFRNQRLVEENQLTNAGFQAEILASLASLVREQGLAVDWAIAPSAWFVAAHADALPDSALISGADLQEWAAAMQTGLLARLDLGGSWIQARCSLGPAFRQRGFQASGQTYADQGLAGTGTFGLAFGGPSGYYWQAAVSLDRSPAPGEFALAGRTLTIPEYGLNYQFSLGVKF